MSRLRLLCFTLFLIFNSHVTQATNACAAVNKPHYACGKTAKFILDVSSTMGNADNIDLLFDFFESKILSAYDFRDYENAGIMSYGSGDVPFMESNNYTTTCIHAETLRNDGINKGLKPQSLVTALQKLYDAYGEGYDSPIVLFSGCNNQSEVEAAEQFRETYLRSAQFTVVALNSSFKIWRNFHTFDTYQVPISEINDFQYLDLCILQHCCGTVEDFCDIKYIGSTSTAAPSTPTAPPTYAPPELQCPCNASSVWNDVMMDFDASENVGEEQLQKNWHYAKKAFSAHTIEKASSGQSMSVGIVLYGDDATVIHNLGEINNEGMLAMEKLRYLGGKGARLDLALNSAWSQLSSDRRRIASRPVIAVFGGAYTGDDAVLQAHRRLFQSKNGDIVVYASPSSNMSPSIQSLAFSSSKLIKEGDDGKAMQAAMCSANCFCASGYTSFKNDINGSPIGGCYKMLPVVMNRPLAESTCTGNGGYVAMDESIEKTNFLNKVSNAKDQWVGLIYNQSTQKFEWSNHRQLGSYQPWAGGQAPTRGGCVLLTQEGTWTISVDCRNSFSACCEYAPCSSINKC